MISLGPFEIEERVGSGAMGQVWRGHHIRTRTPVAVKFVVANKAVIDLAASSVRREARAIAGLQHSHVVYVYDQGVVDPTVSAELEGVPVGSPWIVMELLSGGTLLERHEASSWERLREDLERILEALAHCHARGILHRDLKPANVLFGSPKDSRPGLKLVDFGIAWQGGGGEDALFGTPEFCAPEQLGNEAHSQGPWSDLYALGAIGWTLATGVVPWPDRKGIPLFLAKASGSFLPFQPRIDVPDALGDWLRRSMAGPPGDRFQSAPDALLALRDIGGARHASKSSVQIPLGTEATATRALVGGVGLSARKIGAPPPAPLVREPTNVPIPPPALRDAGLGLWLYRPAQFTARMPQRVRLWQRLEHTIRDRQVHLTALRGPTGSGRTRTARWLLEAALVSGGIHAFLIGGANRKESLQIFLFEILRGRPDDPAGLDNARWMMDHHGITFQTVIDSVERWFEEPNDPQITLRAVVEVIRSLARARPLLLVLDDADLDPALVELALDLAQGPNAQMMIVATCAEPLNSEFVEVPTLDPLRKREISQILSSVIPLDVSSTSDVVAASGGLPGHGLNLVREVFEAHRYEHGDGGLHLNLEPDPPAELPKLPAPLRSLLERAALLGIFPDPAILTQSFGNHRRAEHALRNNEQRGLLTVNGGVIAFGPGVRKAVLATRTPSWKRHHRALARAYPPESAEGALHRVRGGEVAQGFAQLKGAIEALDLGGELYQMLDTCDRGLNLWKSIGVGPAEGPWVFLVLKRVDVLSGLRSPTLKRILETDLELALKHKVWNAVAGLLVERAAFGEPDAHADLHLALEVAETNALRARAHHGLSRQAERDQNMPLARYWLKLAAQSVASSDREAAGHARVARARLATMDGDFKRAAVEVQAAIRNRPVPGELDLMVAGILLARGEIVPARSVLLRGVHWMTLRQDRRWLPTALVRLGLVELLEGRSNQCEARLAEADRIHAENRNRFGTDPSLGAPVRLILCLERGEWYRAMEALGHCRELAWRRPTQVAVMNRVAELMKARTDVPEPVRESIAQALTSFEALRQTWFAR